MHAEQFPWFLRQSRRRFVPAVGCVILFWLLAKSVQAHPDLDVHIQIVTALIAEAPTAELHLRHGELYRQHEDFGRALQDLSRETTPKASAVVFTRAGMRGDENVTWLSGCPCLGATR